MEEKANPLKIILVEDDDGDARAVLRTFKNVKIRNHIYRAEDGVEALDLLRGENEKVKIDLPYILLVDLNMPRMGGIELIKEIRNDTHLKNSVIFVLTTSKSEEDIASAYNLNVAGYILKETAGQDFLDLINFIDYYWKIVEIPMQKAE